MEITPQTHTTATAVEAGQAMSIERRHTEPGVDPFSSVEWEVRDARIAHGDHVAFEQTDVEFPTTWSQNATNIVTQKYFRGQAGSREGSLQLSGLVQRRLRREATVLSLLHPQR